MWSVTHLAYPLQYVQFPRYRRHALSEAGLEKDAENSAREVWDHRELVEKPATNDKHKLSPSPVCFTLCDTHHLSGNLLINVEMSEEELTAQVCREV